MSRGPDSARDLRSSDDESDAGSSELEDIRKMRLGGLAALGILVLGAFLVPYFLHGQSSTAPLEGRSLNVGPPAERKVAMDKCQRNQGPFEFQHVPVESKLAHKAVGQLLRMTKARMATCTPPVGLQIGGGVHEFLRKRHTSASWKYAEDCRSVTFRLKIPLPKRQEVWSGQVSFDMEARHWALLEEGFSPAICDIRNDGQGAPYKVPEPDSDPEVLESAKFAVGMLAWHRQREGCANDMSLELDRVVRASQQVSEAMITLLYISVNVTQASSVRQERACVTVLESLIKHPSPRTLATGINGNGNFSLCSDPSTWGDCVPADHAVRNLRAVHDGPAEPTARLVAQRSWRRYLASRSLQEQGGVKAPIQGHRFIPTGEVPQGYDLRSDGTVGECLTKLPVFDQGYCACCYGAAMAQMFSLRLCVQEKRKEVAKTSRRLRVSVPAPGCSDDLSWKSPGGQGCAWYGLLGRCTSLADVGQLSYCRLTCQTCPDMPVKSHINGELVKRYAYSTQDIATCSCNMATPDDTNVESNCRQRAGCDGGNPYSVWDAWLRFSQRRLMRRHCDPLTIKCLASQGVVNPLSASSCQAYKAIPLWDKPCDCIPQSDMPSGLPQCNLQENACTDLPPPQMIYVLKGTFHGLPVETAVLNMKRHILEDGPIYVTLSVSNEFKLFWAQGLGTRGGVYMGDKDPIAGLHAVILVGWDVTSIANPSGAGIPYWVLRNSWGAIWGEEGYGKIAQGRNANGIEGEAAAAMMGPHADFTPPQLSVFEPTWRWLYLQPDKLCKLWLYLKLSFLEEVTVQVSFSDALPPQSTGEDAVMHTVDRTFRCEGTCVISGIDLLSAGFGLEARDLHVSTAFWDRSGNLGNWQNVFTFPAVDGMGSKGGESICGAPEIACDSGCLEPAWQKPAALSQA